MQRPAHRPFALIRTVDQWRRCAHEDTALDLPEGVVELGRVPAPAAAESEAVELPMLAGMAFDRHCRLFRAEPSPGQITVHRWRPSDPFDPLPIEDSRSLFAPVSSGLLGEFVSEGPTISGPLALPTGVAVDGRDLLYVWESGSGSLLIWDLERARVRDRLQLGFAGPVDLAWIDGRLLGVGPQLPGLLERGEDGHVRLRALPGLTGEPHRIAGDGRGRGWLLLDAGSVDARIVALDGSLVIPVAGASDLVFLLGSDEAEDLVVARGPDQQFRRFAITSAGFGEEPPLAARGYDGRGIVRTPDDRVLYFAERAPAPGEQPIRSIRHAVPARLRFRKRGRVTSFRLDAGEFHTRWGRVFIDACVPTGTELRIAVVTCDDPPDPDDGLGSAPGDEPIERTAPVNAGSFVLKDDGQPPLPAKRFVPATIEGRLAVRSNGRELPWTDPDGSDTHFVTFEAPVDAEPGRYLWLFVELRGNSRRTPRVRSIRVEQIGHPLLRRLPQVYSRDSTAADFLWRFLAMFDGALLDLELRTVLRHAILDPRSTPESFLPWLGDLVGMALDRRWPLAARRKLVAEATWLFRFRGTVPGLSRMIELYLDMPIQIVEHFRVRGLGGAIVGAGEGSVGEQTSSGSVLGAGFRVGGAIGSEAIVDLGSEQSLAELGADGFTTHAHRFTVVVPAALTREQREVVEHILEHHRPAHTLYWLCTLDAGLRVGVGLYAGLSTIVGPTGGFMQLQVGGSTLGRDRIIGIIGIMGRPIANTSVGTTALGKGSRVG